MEYLFLVFEDSSHHFSECLHQFAFLATVNEGFYFPAPPLKFVVICFGDLSHSDWGEMNLKIVLICIF